MWKIDAFCHILPLKYIEALRKKSKAPGLVRGLGRVRDADEGRQFVG